MNVLDLFSGIGGFSLGLERAGMKTVAFCEIEPFCQKVLRKHWPDVPIFEDVRTLHATDISEPIDLICGGYPCQPFSLAGKRRGEADDRHLWPEYLRLIQEIHPRWVIAENVAGHINMGLDKVLSDLENEGYARWPLIIPACAVGADHRRDRVWIVANSKRKPERSRLCESHPGKERRGRPDHGSCEDVADTDSKRLAKRERQNTARKRKDGRPIFGGNTRWPTEPGVGRVANGIPSRVDRLRGLGNAVVPQIPEIIGCAIMQIEGCQA